ncbi:hypothetical protein PMIN01_05505 [Paraphaeosphaeria minitans]|uniref:Uncharacterized protein n=1 Tax=Paraphaeosphaeria minitans TaxID=565426 RepID=A0A9P6KTA1_9PLEO|nr:hypothetical protein PMIN01_05505 [Paraphaeosphaeria minitans]
MAGAASLHRRVCLVTLHGARTGLYPVSPLRRNRTAPWIQRGLRVLVSR